MKLLARAFVYGVGFVAGASLTGALIGYGLGKLAEKQVGSLLRQASTPDNTRCDCGAGEKHGYANRASHDRDCAWRLAWVEAWRFETSRPADWDKESML